MNLRKVYGGTPQGSSSMCDTCIWARIIQGYAESERIVFCDSSYPMFRVPFKVSQCSNYEDRRLPDYDHLKDIAIPLQVKHVGRSAGFRSVSKVNGPEPKDEMENETITEEA